MSRPAAPLITAAAVMALALAAISPAPGGRHGSRFHQASITAIDADWLAITGAETACISTLRIPRSIAMLDGRRVQIVGEMVVPLRESERSFFTLAAETWGKPTQFARNPPVHLVMSVSLRTGHQIDYIRKPVIVEGTLRVRPFFWRGKLTDLYELEEATVAPGRIRPGYTPAISWFGC